MKPNSNLFFLILMLPTLVVFSQEDFRSGYVITNESDTLRGLIQYKGNVKNAKNIAFKESIDQPVNTYKPGMISAYRFDEGKYYESKVVVIEDQEHELFLEYLLYGIANVYYGIIDKKEYYFIEKEGEMYVLPDQQRDVIVDGQSHEVKLTQLKGMLRLVYMDAPAVVNQVETVSFTHKSMIRLAKNYHKQVCDTYDCIIYEKSAKTKVYIEPMIGFANATMRVRNSDDKAFQSIATGGIRVHLTSIKFKDNWHFITGFNFSHVSFDTTEFYIPNANVNNEKRWNLAAEYSYLQIPLAMSYTFGSGKLKPYVLAGGEAVLIISETYSRELLEGNRNRDTYTFRKLQMGFVLGGGIRYQVNDKMQVVLEGTYDSRAPAVRLGGVFDNHHVNTIQVSLGANIRMR